jgi:class 3 adenylate cyclase
MDVPQGRTAAVLFTDLVGSTQLLSRLGEAAYDELRRAHFTVLRYAIGRVGGWEVKGLGDGVLGVFHSATAALDCAVAMGDWSERPSSSGRRRASRIPSSTSPRSTVERRAWALLHRFA